MRLGYCLNMIARGADGIGAEWIPRAREMGMDYVEIALAQSMALGAADFRARILDPLRDAALPCLCCNNFFPGSIRLTGPDADLPAALEYARAALDRAAALGASRVVFGSSGARNRPDGFSRADALSQLEDLLGPLGELARARGLVIVMETLNYVESNVLNHLSETRALVRRVDHPSVRMLVDSYHLWMVNDAPSDAAALGDDLRHVHVARTLGRGLPAPGDDEPWAAFFAALRSAGYDGGVSIEANAPREDTAGRVAEAAAFLRTHMNG